MGKETDLREALRRAVVGEGLTVEQQSAELRRIYAKAHAAGFDTRGWLRAAAHTPLTTDERKALPADMFAVPDKRELPIKDPDHVREAWDMVDRTAGLTDAERAEARRRILRRARDLGVDTADWTKKP